MDLLFKSIPLLNFASVNYNNDGIVNIIDGNRNLCGFFELDSKSQIIAYDKLGRFSGYYISNSLGNTERYDAIGNFEGYIVTDKNLVKYDKTGKYQGYYIVSDNGEINEYNSCGQYLGHYAEEDDKKIIRFDSLGHCELIFGENSL